MIHQGFFYVKNLVRDVTKHLSLDFIIFLLIVHYQIVPVNAVLNILFLLLKSP